MSDTPKTDAVADIERISGHQLVKAGFCRRIGRECNAWVEQAARSERRRSEQQQCPATPESELKRLRDEIEGLMVERSQLDTLLAEQRRLAEMRHSVIAAAVLETVRDRSATWDEASDDLVWSEGRGCQNIRAEHLEATCVRYPQWAPQLRRFYDEWNKEERITVDMLADIDYDITSEDAEKSWRQTKRIIDFHTRLRDMELRLEAAENALENCRLTAARRSELGDDTWIQILRFCEEGRAKPKPVQAPYAAMDEPGG